jgi:hypothetical protein
VLGTRWRAAIGVAGARHAGAAAAFALCLGLLLVLDVGAEGASAARPGARPLTVYTVAAGVQFINTADDRARGYDNNPFDSVTNRLRAAVNDKGSGPFPGDVAVFSFRMFSDRKLARSAGSAVYTCYFNYAKHALCKSFYEFPGNGGTVVAAGPVDFSQRGFKLVVTGGTKRYQDLQGQVTSTPIPGNVQRVTIGPGLRSGAGGQQRVRVFAEPTTAQFMNHADDRVRGMSTNPFNVSKKALDLVIITNGKEKGNGPFPGDDILYTFKLYSGKDKSRRAGSAIFTCYYNFAKHAICDSYFDFGDGLVLASGPVVFDSTRFTLSVAGGTGKYAQARGAVTATPATKTLERFALRLLG